MSIVCDSCNKSLNSAEGFAFYSSSKSYYSPEPIGNLLMCEECTERRINENKFQECSQLSEQAIYPFLHLATRAGNLEKQKHYLELLSLKGIIERCNYFGYDANTAKRVARELAILFWEDTRSGPSKIIDFWKNGNKKVIRNIELIESGQKSNSNQVGNESRGDKKSSGDVQSESRAKRRPSKKKAKSNQIGARSPEATDAQKGCFIVTATYGSSMANEVNTFRKFRDEYLAKPGIGNWLINSYYRFSPPVAKLIEKRKLLRLLIRKTVLEPILFLIRHLNYCAWF